MLRLFAGSPDWYRIQDYTTSWITPRGESASHSPNVSMRRFPMSSQERNTSYLHLAASMLATTLLATTLALAGEPERGVFVLTSTNNPSANEVVVFKLDAAGTPSLSLTGMLPTQGRGGAGGNAGILQFKDASGAVANYGSNSVSKLVRSDDLFSVAGTINLAPGCVQPDSVALTREHLFVVGANCAESHAWPAGG